MNELQESTSYQELAERHNAAYVAFQAMYALRNPLPTAPELPERPAPPAAAELNRFDVFVTGILLFGSAVVSMTRTTQEFAGNSVEFGNILVGFFAFVMLEVAGVSYAYFRTKFDYTERRHAEVLKWIERGLVLALVTAIFANLHQALQQHDVDIPLFNVINIVLGGFAPPLLAFIAGDILGSLVVRQRKEQRRLDEQYQRQTDDWKDTVAALRQDHEAQIANWRDELNASWYASPLYKKVRVQVVKDETLPSALPSVSVSNQTDSRQTAYGFSRTSDGAQRVVEWLSEHPDDSALPLRTLGERVGVNKDTASKGLKMWRVEQNAV
jgi:hypothetical protein